MTDFIIRDAEPSDLNGIVRLWQEVFGDEPVFIYRFLRALSFCGDVIIAEHHSTIVSMSVVIRDIFLGSTPCSYLYAVATKEEFRGQNLASRILHICVEQERQKYNAIVFTAPAEPDLFSWYRKTICAEHVLSCTKKTVSLCPQFKTLPVIKLDPSEYYKKRERILQDLPHLIIGNNYLHLAETLCSSYNGGLYQIGDGISAVYIEGSDLHCQEILTGSETDHDIIQTLLRYFDTDSAHYRVPGDGTDYIASLRPFPNNEWFGLIMD